MSATFFLPIIPLSNSLSNKLWFINKIEKSIKANCQIDHRLEGSEERIDHRRKHKGDDEIFIILNVGENSRPVLILRIQPSLSSTHNHSNHETSCYRRGCESHIAKT